MPSNEIDLRPVSHIMTDAIGPPGKRVFYLQGWKEDRTITLIVEKFQIQSLAVGFDQFMTELSEKYPDLPEASSEYNQEKTLTHLLHSGLYDSTEEAGVGSLAVLR